MENCKITKITSSVTWNLNTFWMSSFHATKLHHYIDISPTPSTWLNTLTSTTSSTRLQHIDINHTINTTVTHWHINHTINTTVTHWHINHAINTTTTHWHQPHHQHDCNTLTYQPHHQHDCNTLTYQPHHEHDYNTLTHQPHHQHDCNEKSNYEFKTLATVQKMYNCPRHETLKATHWEVLVTISKLWDFANAE